MKPFLHGKKPSPIPTVGASRPGAMPVSSSVPTPPGLGSVVRGTGAGSALGGDPAIDVVKEGDKVVRLVITCSCGERMEVECIYPAGV